MDSATRCLSKKCILNICHGEISKVTAVDKVQKFRVETPHKAGNTIGQATEKKVAFLTDFPLQYF